MDTQYGRYYYLLPNKAVDYLTVREECVSRGWYPSTLQGENVRNSVLLEIYMSPQNPVEHHWSQFGGGSFPPIFLCSLHAFHVLVTSFIWKR